MYLGMSGRQRQEMRISPSLIQYTHILQLSGLELRDLIMQELEDNPAPVSYTHLTLPTSDLV